MHGDSELTAIYALTFEPIAPAPSSGVPAFGVMAANAQIGGSATTFGESIFHVQAPQGPQLDRMLYVNGPRDVAYGGFGKCTTAVERPVYALYSQAAGSPYLGQIWGPINDNTFRLYPGLPGFRIAGTPDSSTGRVPVVRDTHGTCFAKSLSRWETTTITAHPVVSADGTTVYDGSNPNFPSSTFTVTTRGNARFPNPYLDFNIQTNDIFIYRQFGGGNDPTYGLYPDPMHLDAKLGTIRLWSSTYPVPKGWALCDSSANSVTNGGSGIDMRGYFPVGYDARTGGSLPAYSDSAYNTVALTGGNKQYSLTGETLSGASSKVLAFGSSVTTVDNRPPFTVLKFIERVY